MQAALWPRRPSYAARVLPALHFINFLPSVKPLFDQTLLLILEKNEKMLVQHFTAGQNKQCSKP